MIRAARRDLEQRVLERAAKLPPDARAALADMLVELRLYGLKAAEVSLRRSKWMVHAYWRVVAVYAGHFARLVRRAG